MKISIIIPEGDWMMNLVPELRKLRYEVIVNNCDDDCNVILAMTHTEWKVAKYLHEKYFKTPLIILIWDWFDYVNKGSVRWTTYLQLAKESKEVWFSSRDTAKRCGNDIGLKTDFYFNSFIIPWEWKGKNRDWGYVIQAGRVDPNKRFDWYERACDELKIPYKSYHLHINSRPDYIRTVKNCSLMVMAAREEAFGGLPCMEAAYCKKPILVSDYGGFTELWGDDAIYFKKDSYEDFKDKLEWLWENYKSKEVQDKVERAYQKVKNYMPNIVAKQVSRYLNEKIKH